jgi:hypothetical protein
MRVFVSVRIGIKDEKNEEGKEENSTTKAGTV